MQEEAMNDGVGTFRPLFHKRYVVPNHVTSIVFVVPGLPIAQPRHRTRIVTTVGRMFTQAYTPKAAPVVPSAIAWFLLLCSLASLERRL